MSTTHTVSGNVTQSMPNLNQATTPPTINLSVSITVTEATGNTGMFADLPVGAVVNFNASGIAVGTPLPLLGEPGSFSFTQ